jgi:hypothetical protein
MTNFEFRMSNDEFRVPVPGAEFWVSSFKFQIQVLNSEYSVTIVESSG